MFDVPVVMQYLEVYEVYIFFWSTLWGTWHAFGGQLPAALHWREPSGTRGNPGTARLLRPRRMRYAHHKGKLTVVQRIISKHSFEGPHARKKYGHAWRDKKGTLKLIITDWTSKRML